MGWKRGDIKWKDILKERRNELLKIYRGIEPEIMLRLNGFKKLWIDGSEKEIFKELIFCLLTPQSKAERCWESVINLEKKGLLLNGNTNELVEELKNVRFRFTKAKYISEARKKFSVNGTLRIREEIKKFKDIFEMREYLVRNLKGVGYKEASHFLRNIGISENLAILDRHILGSFKILGVIDKIPKRLSRRNYIEIEKRMIKFSKKVNIPLSHLDFVLWYMRTGRIFK